ncbi:MAG: DUF2079 domain-containing protein [bacterium]|nr:DUF2079 domain-containing protein [bacterium]
MKRKGQNKRTKDKKFNQLIFFISYTALFFLGILLYKSLPFSIWKVFFLIFLISTFAFLLSSLLNLNKDIPKSISLILLFFITGIYIAVYSYLSIIQYNGLFTGHFDLAIFDQAIWNTIHGRILDTTMLDYNFLGAHMSPILILLAPFYPYTRSEKLKVKSQKSRIRDRRQNIDDKLSSIDIRKFQRV